MTHYDTKIPTLDLQGRDRYYKIRLFAYNNYNAKFFGINMLFVSTFDVWVDICVTHCSTIIALMCVAIQLYV